MMSSNKQVAPKALAKASVALVIGEVFKTNLKVKEEHILLKMYLANLKISLIWDKGDSRNNVGLLMGSISKKGGILL